MHRSTLAAVVFLIPSLAPVASAGEFTYEADDPPMRSVKVLDDAKLGSVVESQLKSKGLTAKNVATGETGLGGLSREVKQALLMAISMRPLAENDLMVEGKGSFTPVQVLWEAGSLSFTVGAPREKLYGPGPSSAELQKKYGVGEFVDDGAAWDNDMRFVVDLALARMSKDELAPLAGLPFHRIPKPTTPSSARGVQSAVYRQDSKLPRARIELYDAARENDRLRFSGTVDAPVPQSAATVMHELAHALSRAGSASQVDEMKAARKALEEATNAFNEGQQKYNADRAEFAKTKDPELRKSLEVRAAATKGEAAHVKALQKTWSDLATGAQQGAHQSPTETAFLAKLPLASAPTLYGRTLPTEAFAESYRLWKFDRAALERAAPGIAAWFDSEAFTGTLKPR